ncbi:hypothetical protein F2Q69_00046538 [Brassica cretica]|uniref:Putative plant transposon protein domain-containing protein n=1 Tax=Brassica cretica TaxID=69181 RepID=A0A8S9PMW3_BRACR|nr:hypothetical protein F2Q69_00046538 [Brassica cretica]
MTYSSSASIHRGNRDAHSASTQRGANPSPEHAGDHPARFMIFESRLEASQRFIIGNEPVANLWSLGRVTEESFCKCQQLCIRGFLVQEVLLLDDPAIAEARRIVDNVGWMYSVLHARPFCPRVVRECVSNLCSADERVYIRGSRFDFDPVVINQLFMTPFVENSHTWEDEDLMQTIVFLISGRCPNAMIKQRLHFLFAFVRNKPIDFGRLVYDQVVDMAPDSDAHKKIILPNLIYQTLILQREITSLPGDEPLIGHPQ